MFIPSTAAKYLCAGVLLCYLGNIQLAASVGAEEIGFDITEEEQGVSVVMHLTDLPTEAPVAASPEHTEPSSADHFPDLHHGHPIPTCPDQACGTSHDPGFPATPSRNLLTTRDRSGNPPHRYTLPNSVRAGSPRSLAIWAKPSVNKRYSAWFVGGGAAFFGSPCCEPEGTWGMDYHGWLKPRRVWLRWTRGRYQGGEGAYKTDGHTELGH